MTDFLYKVYRICLFLCVMDKKVSSVAMCFIRFCYDSFKRNVVNKGLLNHV
jgi:hypothetical protein